LTRLDKYLCDAGIGTRSEVKNYIKKGRVSVNGSVVKNADLKLDENKDQVLFEGKAVSVCGLVYYMLHKPAGYISATKDDRDQTVLDLLADAPGKDLAPVGRLDKDTEGLLLITNDGALSHRLLSPKKHVDKTYLVHTKDPVTAQMATLLENGVDIGDEKPTRPAKVTLLSETCQLLLTITEGRFHQVKRMMIAVGTEVVYLKRLSMGSLVLDETLPKGSFRPLTEKEKAELGVL